MLILFALLAFGCDPWARSQATIKKPVVEEHIPIITFYNDQHLPDNAELIGKILIGNSGFSTRCDWPSAMLEAKKKARKRGASLINWKIHLPPGIGNNCHRMQGELYSFPENQMDQLVEERRILEKGTFHPKRDFARVYFFRYKSYGYGVTLNLKLNGEVFKRLGANSYISHDIQLFGSQQFSIDLQNTTTLPVFLEKGYEYYVFVGLDPEGPGATPILEEVGAIDGQYALDVLRARM